MRRTVLIYLFVVGLLSGVAFGESHRLLPIESYVPPEGSTVWNLSGCHGVGDELPADVAVVGDSLIEVRLPRVRYVFQRDGDTLRRVVSETRYVRLTDCPALTVATPMRESAICFSSTQTGFAHHSTRIKSDGSMMLMPDVLGSMVIGSADTIAGVVLRQTKERQCSVVSDSITFVRSRHSGESSRND